MNWKSRSETAVLVCITVLCAIIFSNLVNKLRKVLPYRANCWFCNVNTWVRFPQRNCWTCPACDQYNGFTKDGDYNRPLPPATEPLFKTPRRVQRSPGSCNGLCRMCNVNQQLKVAQLANFVPMHDATFHQEIDSFKVQLEKAYRLCSRCRKVLKAKLHKEKETLLGSKLIESRSPKKDNQNKKQSSGLKKFIKYFAMTITMTLIILMTVDGYSYVMKYKSIKSTVVHSKQVVYSLLATLTSLTKRQAYRTFPFLRDYEEISYPVFFLYYNDLSSWIEHVNAAYLSSGINLQEVLGGAGFVTQLLSHLPNQKTVKYQTITDILWAILLVSFIVHSVAAPVLLVVKLTSAVALFFLYKSVSFSTKKSIFASPLVSPMRMKNLTRGSDASWTKSDSDSDLETDDDVSLSQYGINNSNSSTEAKSPSDSSFVSGRVNTSYLKNPASIWSSPSTNTTLNCSTPFVNGAMSQVCYAAPHMVLRKAEFNRYQKMETEDSDSDLDEGINGLHLGTSPKKSLHSGNIFSIKKFDVTSPRFAVPSASHRRPLISPSKLGQGTSWVAGGYWGAEGTRDLYDVTASRSSSQSSGFESLTSNFTQRNVFSQPPSREDSVCSETDRTSIFCDPAPHKFGAVPNGFRQAHVGHLRSPVHPQMRYDGHIHIPLPLAPHSRLNGQYASYHEAPGPMGSRVFPAAPAGARLIKLPPVE